MLIISKFQNGQVELMEVLSGETITDNENEILLESIPIGFKDITERRQLGIETIPEERTLHATVPNLTISENKSGIILYLRQEGRGIGLKHKIKAYKLQEEGMDTVEANNELGFSADLRDYGVGAQILKDLDAIKLTIMTNNPKKLIGLEGHGVSPFNVRERCKLKGSRWTSFSSFHMRYNCNGELFIIY